MRTAHDLFPELCDPAHLERAADATVRGKRRRRDVAWFLFRREEELARLHAELSSGRYRPEGLELITIRDPKRRLIARLPIADRVVQTALVHLMEPVFLRRLRPEAFACRQGYGAHRAVLRLLELLRRHRFALHLDLRSYFPSVDLGILRRILARHLRDGDFLAVLDRVLEGGEGIDDRPGIRARADLAPGWPPPGRGLPIGSYTSQLFAAHVYLADFDHFVKRRLRAPGYLRYVDDLFLFGDRRADLRHWRAKVTAWLDTYRALMGELEELLVEHPELAQLKVLDCAGRSLMNRRSDGDLRFAHRSIQEFLVAHAFVDGQWRSTQPIRTSDQIFRFIFSWIAEEPSQRLPGVLWQLLDLADVKEPIPDLESLAVANLSGTNLQG